ncbi:MAG TPA: hypothetical protein VNE17_12050 [Nitrolancea sp.]|nr:hypothetical protein [Nitrolancea sp.]
MPLIFFMSWKSCRRVGQAFSETASWAVGYFVGTGILLMLHYGGVGLISATPDDPAAIVSVITGFIGMGFSRYLWKRRGGHLEPINHPIANSRYVRAGRAMLFSGKKKPVARQQATVKRTTTPAATPNRVATDRPTTTTSAATTQSTTRPPSTANNSTTRPTTSRSTATPGKSNAARWGRVIGAMIQTDDSQRRPPPR